MTSTKGSMSQDTLYAYTSFWDQKKVQVVRIFLNEHDNVTEHFWKTFTGALAVWDLQFSQRERQSPFPGEEERRRAFFESLAQCLEDNPLMLSVNDIQLLSNGVVQGFLEELMDLRSSGLYVVLLYNEGKTPRGLLGAKRNISSLRNCYLSPAQEMEYYRNQSVELTNAEFSKAREITDGWVSAVELLGKYLVSEGKVKLLENIDDYLVKWGNTQFTGAYAEPERLFLICLSLLDSFPLELIQSLSAWNGEALIKLMENSPFVRYDLESQRFRFAGYLYKRFKKQEILLDSKTRQDFFTAVGDWYRDRGDSMEAIANYRKARANQRMLKLMQRWAFPNTRELAACCIDAISEMPTSFLERHPVLHVIRGYMLCTVFRYDDADILIERFCSANDHGADTPQVMLPVLGEAYLLWANIRTCLLWDENELFWLYKRAVELLPGGSSLVTSKLGRFADVPAIRLTGPQAGALRAGLDRLILAEPFVSRLSGGGWTGSSYLGMAEYDYYIRDFRDVSANANRAIVAALEKEQYDIVCSAYFLLMRFNFAKGNYHRTMESYEALRQAAAEASYDTFFSTPHLAEAWLLLRLGRPHEIADWLRDDIHARQTVPPWSIGRNCVVHCQYLLDTQRYEDVLDRVDADAEILIKRGHRLLAVHLWIMSAIASNCLGDAQRAVELFEEVYYWSHANGIVMQIVEQGHHIRPLVQSYLRSGRDGIPATWLEDIDTKARSYYVYLRNIRKQYGEQFQGEPSLLERMNGAEQRLLLMLTKGMSLREISLQFGKSSGAVKSMCHRLYTKIGASGKQDAARIGRECGIESIVHI